MSERCCIISRARNTRSYMTTVYQDGAAGPHGFGKQDRTCQVGAAGYHRLGTGDRTCLRGIRTGLQDLTGSEHQIVFDYEVSGRGCRISRVWNTISYMPSGIRTGCRISRLRNTRSYTPTRYQDGAAGSHGLGPQIEHAYELRVRTSERICIRSCRISWVETSERTCIGSCNHVPINVFPQNGGAGIPWGLDQQKSHFPLEFDKTL